GEDAGPLARHVQLDDAVKVPAHIEDDGHVAALAGQARAAAATEERRAVAATDLHGPHELVGAARTDDPDRELPVIGAVGRIEGAGPGVEADLSLELSLE